MTITPGDKTSVYEKALIEADAQVYVLKLYISGMTSRSRQAIVNLKNICETHLPGRYRLEVIDLYQQPELAAKYHIIATPTLLKSLPLPLTRFIGNLSDSANTLRRLGLERA